MVFYINQKNSEVGTKKTPSCKATVKYRKTLTARFLPNVLKVHL